MTLPIRIDTARLTMLRPSTADTGEIFERYASDPDVTRFLGWPRHETMEDTRGLPRFSSASWRVLEKCGFERGPRWTRQMEFPNLAPGVNQAVMCFARLP